MHVDRRTLVGAEADTLHVVIDQRLAAGRRRTKVAHTTPGSMLVAMTSGGSSFTGMDPQAFEQEVRRVAGLLYPDTYGGATKVDGLERDGVFITEDTVALTRSDDGAR